MGARYDLCDAIASGFLLRILNFLSPTVIPVTKIARKTLWMLMIGKISAGEYGLPAYEPIRNPKSYGPEIINE
jgi:hypothetical protein